MASGATSKIRIHTLRQFKDDARRIVMVTAYDALTARWVDEAGVDVVLVGDSLGRSALGLERELQVTLDQMVHHCAAVARGARRALRVGDLPFMTCKVSPERALDSAARMIQAGGMEAVKLEGGVEMASTVARLVRAGLPVMGHVGLLPQSFHAQGGYRIQGADEAGAARIEADAHALQEAGAFAVVLEAIPPSVAARITQSLTIPTLGIGAGLECDGQVLVVTDLLGMSDGPTPRLARAYASLGDEARRALEAFADDVREGRFPGPEQVYGET